MAQYCAKNEYDDYSNGKLEEIWQLVEDVNEKCKKLSTAKNRLDQIFKGLRKKNTKSRKVKDNRRKARKRKEEWLHQTRAELKSKIIKLEVKEGATQCITKEMLHLLELEKLRRDRHTKVALINHPA